MESMFYHYSSETEQVILILNFDSLRKSKRAIRKWVKTVFEILKQVVAFLKGMS